jgi:hypothetical protein
MSRLSFGCLGCQSATMATVSSNVPERAQRPRRREREVAGLEIDLLVDGEQKLVSGSGGRRSVNRSEQNTGRAAATRTIRPTYHTGSVLSFVGQGAFRTNCFGSKGDGAAIGRSNLYAI